MKSQPGPRSSAPQGGAASWLSPLLPVLAACLAHWESLGGAFTHDDASAVLNVHISSSDWWGAAFGAEHNPCSGRPVTCLALALTAASAGMTPRGFHVLSLVIHILNAQVLRLLIQRSLRTNTVVTTRMGAHAVWWSTVIATVFACHPLATEAVAYITQLSTLLMALAMLTVLLLSLHRHISSFPLACSAFAVLASAVGMGCKEDMVVAPFLVILLDRAFVFDSFTAMRRQAPFYVALCATWTALAACVALAPSNPTTGYATATATSALDWLRTQAPVVMHYARLAVFPYPLRTVYDWPIVRSWEPYSLFTGFVILATLLSCIWIWRRRPPIAWLVLAFFLLLAPTSSLYPIVSEVVAERRAYLAMIPPVLGTLWLLQLIVSAIRSGTTTNPGTPLFTPVLLGLLIVCIVATRAHSGAYATELAVWEDAYSKNSLTNQSQTAGNILTNYAVMLRQQGRLPESQKLLDRAVQCEAPMSATFLNYAISLVERGKKGEAEATLRSLLQGRPKHAAARYHLSLMLMDPASASGSSQTLDRLAEAGALLKDLVNEAPNNPVFRRAYGALLERQGKTSEAQREYRRAAELGGQGR